MKSASGAASVTSLIMANSVCTPGPLTAAIVGMSMLLAKLSMSFQPSVIRW